MPVAASSRRRRDWMFTAVPSVRRTPVRRNAAERSALRRTGVLRTEGTAVNIQSRRRRLLAATGMGLLLGGLASCHYGSEYTLPTLNVPNSVAIADVDGDGIPDLLVATTADQGNVQNPGFANVILGNHSSPGTFHTG